MAIWAQFPVGSAWGLVRFIMWIICFQLAMMRNCLVLRARRSSLRASTVSFQPFWLFALILTCLCYFCISLKYMPFVSVLFCSHSLAQIVWGLSIVDFDTAAGECRFALWLRRLSLHRAKVGRKLPVPVSICSTSCCALLLLLWMLQNWRVNFFAPVTCLSGRSYMVPLLHSVSALELGFGLVALGLWDFAPRLVLRTGFQWSIGSALSTCLAQLGSAVGFGVSAAVSFDARRPALVFGIPRRQFTVLSQCGPTPDVWQIYGNALHASEALDSNSFGPRSLQCITSFRCWNLCATVWVPWLNLDVRLRSAAPFSSRGGDFSCLFRNGIYFGDKPWT